MKPITFYLIEAIIPMIQLLNGLWCKYLAPKKIQDPTKNLFAQCCYYSKLSVSSQELWDMGQKLYGEWNLKYFLPSFVSAMACVTVFMLVVKPESLDLMSTLIFVCCLMVPVIWMQKARRNTEKELRSWFQKQQES